MVTTTTVITIIEALMHSVLEAGPTPSLQLRCRDCSHASFHLMNYSSWS
jgi:hypothetical protein